MNPSYYGNQNYPTSPPGNSETPIEDEQSFIENILRLNKGKEVKIYASYPDSIEWRDKIFDGVLEEAGKDHIIINDKKNNKHYLILIIYINYIEFNEEINYSHAYSEKTF